MQQGLFYLLQRFLCDFPGGSDGKASVYNVRDLGSIPGLGRFPGEENGNPLQYSCLENPMDGGAWCRLLSRGYKESGTTERLHFHFFTFTRLMVLKSLVNFHSCPSPFQMEHKQTGDFVLIKISKILTFSPDDNYIFSHLFLCH